MNIHGFQGLALKIFLKIHASFMIGTTTTVKAVMRGHLSGCLKSKLHFLLTKWYFNIEMYLRRGDTCHVGTLFWVSLVTGFTVQS